MTPALAREIARAAGVEAYFDRGLRLWTFLHPSRNARGKALAQHVPSPILRQHSPATLWREVVCPAAGSQWEDLRDLPLRGRNPIPTCVLIDMVRRMPR